VKVRSAARRTIGNVTALAGAITATALAPLSLADVREFGAWLLRPIALPLAWSAMTEAQRSGDATEAFARGQQVLHLVPRWTDGHAVFAYRHVLDETAIAGDLAERAAAMRRRLVTALAWLDDARATAGRHEVDLLLAMAFLPQVAALQLPALEDHLRENGGSAGLADGYLAAAERLRPSAAIREQRTFFLPRLAAALLGNGARDRAIEVLDTAIRRSDDVRDRDLAAEWRARLEEARRWLSGDHDVDLGAVHADPRFAPLHPWLR